MRWLWRGRRDAGRLAKTGILAQENCAIGKRVKTLFMAELKFGPAEKRRAKNLRER